MFFFLYIWFLTTAICFALTIAQKSYESPYGRRSVNSDIYHDYNILFWCVFIGFGVSAFINIL